MNGLVFQGTIKVETRRARLANAELAAACVGILQDAGPGGYQGAGYLVGASIRNEVDMDAPALAPDACDGVRCLLGQVRLPVEKAEGQDIPGCLASGRRR